MWMWITVILIVVGVLMILTDTLILGFLGMTFIAAALFIVWCELKKFFDEQDRYFW